jgi:hypothetical protein
VREQRISRGDHSIKDHEPEDGFWRRLKVPIPVGSQAARQQSVRYSPKGRPGNRPYYPLRMEEFSLRSAPLPNICWWSWPDNCKMLRQSKPSVRYEQKHPCSPHVGSLQLHGFDTGAPRSRGQSAHRASARYGPATGSPCFSVIRKPKLRVLRVSVVNDFRLSAIGVSPSRGYTGRGHFPQDHFLSKRYYSPRQLLKACQEFCRLSGVHCGRQFPISAFATRSR